MTIQTLPPIDVAIIGFGPVGASLAALLGQRGCRVAVFDKSEQIYPLPRAFALDHEAMRTFQQIGIAGALSAHITPYRPTIYQGSDGQPIQHFDMGPAPYPLAWAPSYTFNQPALETALRAAVSALPNVQVHLGHEVTDVKEAHGGATLAVQAPAGGQSAVHARYVVACDGGTSPTRKRLGLRLKSLDFDEPWIVVDMHVNESVLARLPDTNIQYCNPARPCTYVVGPGTHRRWEFLLLPHEAEQREMPPHAIWQLLAPWLAPGEATIWRAATYRFHAVVLEQWRQGPVLLAGDSAHQMPPFLAQGMCQGLRDAANLAWKLDWVLKGHAGDELLDSYGTERGPQVEAVTATVKRLGQIICERDPARARERDENLRAQQGHQVRMQLRQSLLPGVHHGLIDRDQAPMGTPFPQPVCRIGTAGQERRMDDLLGHGFVLVLRDAPSAELAAQWAEALQRLQAQMACIGTTTRAVAGVQALHEADGILARWFEQHGCSAALVRPDHIVYGVAQGAAQTTELLQRACEHLAGQPAAAHGAPTDLHTRKHLAAPRTARPVPASRWAERGSSSSPSLIRKPMNCNPHPHADTEALLRDLEAQRCDAMKRADFARLREILHPGLTHVHAKGQTDDYDSYFRSGGTHVDYQQIDRSELKVQVLGTSAVMTGRQLLVAVRKDGTGTVRIDSRVMQVWTQEDGAPWRQIAFQTTPLEMSIT